MLPRLGQTDSSRAGAFSYATALVWNARMTLVALRVLLLGERVDVCVWGRLGEGGKLAPSSTFAYCEFV